MTRLLVTGASGLLGANLALTAVAAGHEVTGTYHSFPVPLKGVEMVGCDVGAPGELEAVLEAARPVWVVHCAGATDVDRCQADPPWAERLNRVAARRVARAARRAGARLVHISTDAVFDGETGGYRESDPPRPINVYGRTKWEGEQAVAEEHESAIIVRTNFFGWSPRGERSLAEWFLARMEAGEPSPGFTDVLFSPLLVNSLARLILALLETGAAGLFHLAGRTCLSKYEFGIRLAQAFSFPSGLVQPGTVSQADLQAPRPLRLCLRSDRIEAWLSRPMPDLTEGIAELKALLGSGHAIGPRDRLSRRSPTAAS